MLRSTIGVVVMILALGLLNGCVPSAPPTAPPEEESSLPVPEASGVDALPEAQEEKAKPETPRPSSSTGEEMNGLMGFSMNPMERPNAFAKVVRKKDVSGYAVSGSFDLDASIQWNAAQKQWLFKGSLFFSDAEVKLMEISSHPLGAVETPASDAPANEQAGIWLIEMAITAAPEEGGDAEAKVEHPFSYAIQAPSNAYFSVTFIQDMT